ncbi:MAG: lipopolysaccharide biosynthesis protein [Gammaproteobacteria bacterium]
MNNDNKKQYASVLEQIFMSGSSMITSIVVLSKGGVSNFGIYSFIQVISLLITGAFMTLLHRQMMLAIASYNTKNQRRFFLATMKIEIVGLFLFMLLVAGGWYVLSKYLNIIEFQKTVFLASLYITLFVIYDAFKQYSYTTENQIYSLKISVVFLSFQALMLAYLYFYTDSKGTLENIYLCLSASLAIGILSNRYCIKNLLHARSVSYKFCRKTISIYFKQGRFSLFGMAITWVQNQSMNPFLMLIGGPVIAGYFSIGRLFIMPVAVVTQGIVNSTLPKLRRLYKNSGETLLTPQIHLYFLKTSAFTVLYFTLLALLHFAGMLDSVLTDYAHIKLFLLYWITISTLTMIRFWVAQFFIVTMKFKFLLNLSIISALVTVTGMTTFGIHMNSISLALATVIFSECLIIVVFHLEKKRLKKPV